MSRVRLILVALLFCCTIRVEARDDTTYCTRKVVNGPILSAETVDGGKVELVAYTVYETVKEGNCFELVCEGFATPHRKITWYRLYDDHDNSSGLPIVEYWAERYYYDSFYEYDSTNSDNGGISSILRINNFIEGYAGFYYCIITNGDSSVQSPLTNLTLEKPFRAQDDPKSLTEPLYVINITAVKVDNTSLRVSWGTIQRIPGAKFCRFYQEGTTRKESFKWTLHILTWPNFNNLTANPSYENITTQKYFSSYQNSYNITLSKAQCNKKNYLFTNLTSTFYYKFQIMVEKYKKEEDSDHFIVKNTAKNGSHVHYFGKLTQPKITYPSPLLKLCKPFDPNICEATGNPPPRVQLLQPVENNNIYKCFAENTHIHNSGEKTRDYEIVDFYWNTTSACGPMEKPASPPKPSCVPMRSSVCNQYIPRGSMVYLPIGININTLEEHAQAAVGQLIKDDSNCYSQMVKFICYSYLALCHMDTPVPRSVCSQSCDALMMKCHNTTFSNIKNDLPEWSINRNCSKLRQTKTGSVVECIHLSVPPVDTENHSDGSCVVGKGTKYTGNYSNPGCITWDDHRQTYFDISVFTELQSAGSSCRNPDGSGERPWCYVNLTSNAVTRWEYCDVPKCSTCERVPEVCRTAYQENTTVYVHENSYPTDIMQAKCFSDSRDRCHRVWNTIICHLAYPKCVEAKDTDRVHSYMPLCRSYCNKVQNITSTCQIPSPCNQSYFKHQLNNINCSALDEVDCMYADLELDFPMINSLVAPTSDTTTTVTAIVGAQIGIIFCIMILLLIVILLWCYSRQRKGKGNITTQGIQNPELTATECDMSEKSTTATSDGSNCYSSVENRPTIKDDSDVVYKNTVVSKYEAPSNYEYDNECKDASIGKSHSRFAGNDYEAILHHSEYACAVHVYSNTVRESTAYNDSLISECSEVGNPDEPTVNDEQEIHLDPGHSKEDIYACFEKKKFHMVKRNGVRHPIAKSCPTSESITQALEKSDRALLTSSVQVTDDDVTSESQSMMLGAPVTAESQLYLDLQQRYTNKSSTVHPVISQLKDLADGKGSSDAHRYLSLESEMDDSGTVSKGSFYSSLDVDDDSKHTTSTTLQIHSKASSDDYEAIPSINENEMPHFQLSNTPAVPSSSADDHDTEYRTLDEALPIDEQIYEDPGYKEEKIYAWFEAKKFRRIRGNDIKVLQVLASGEFGVVHLGLWSNGSTDPVQVAVKTLNSQCSVSDRVKLLREAAIMGQFVHNNVVQLHGVVTEEENMMIVLEYMPKGDLQNHLLKVKTLNTKSKEAVIELNHDLLSYCRQIALGLNYLANKQFVHRDLAARNILVSSDDVCKIADFGMARDVADDTYYITTGGKIPLKWTAPEAIFYKKYSVQSDVWSFGCVMYEIWSLGHKPFEDLSGNEYIWKTATGYRLPPPPGCPRAIYELMIQCWHPTAKSRPTSGSLSQILQKSDRALLTSSVQVTDDDVMSESQSMMLGAPLTAGSQLYLDLQQRYVLK